MSKLTYQESFFELDWEEWDTLLDKQPDLIPGYKELDADEWHWSMIMADYDAVKWAEYKREEEEENEATRRHVAALIAEHGEDTLRALLKTISADIELNHFREISLSEHDLVNTPVETILNEYGSWLRLEIEILPHRVYRVSFGKAYRTVGGGGIWEIQRLGHEFLPAERVGEWRC
jgi:hypothetical protein